MSLSEFTLIDRFFRDCGARRADVPLGVGDDGAVLECPPGRQLVAAIDTLVEGVHFPSGSPPESIGHRALAVNLSDLAAMGAEPAWALLALTLGEAREEWLSDFARGIGMLAREHNVALVGGDTTSGPLTITVQVLGFVETSRALRRSGARPGDVVFVSGTPGDAAGGLIFEMKGNAALDESRTPNAGDTTPALAAAGSADPRRASLGTAADFDPRRAQLGAAAAAADSRHAQAGASPDFDPRRGPPGVAGDFDSRRVQPASAASADPRRAQPGAAADLDPRRVQVVHLINGERRVAHRPRLESISALRNRFLFPTPRVSLGRRLLDFASACIDVSDGLLGDAGKLAQASGCAVELDYRSIPISLALADAFGEQRARELALSGGDDYELCFAVPPAHVDALLDALPLERWSYTRIGVIKDGTGARVIDNGTVMDFSHSGYDHFSAPR